MLTTWRRSAPRRSLVSAICVATAVLTAACAGRRVTEVAPAEIPELEAQLARAPDHGALRARYAAALFTANRCDEAVAEGRRAQVLVPADPVPTLVIGQCLERGGQYEDALTAYRAYLATHDQERGASMVRAREMLAFRAHATERARLALQNEAQLAQQPGDPNTIAVLPLEIAGDTVQYGPLSRGLAQILTSDLALLERFRLVERLHLGALLDELALAQGGRVDVSTAARVGRLMQAGRLVSGLAAIPPEGDVRLEANVVLPTGEVTGPEAVTGRFRDLLRIEKDLVIRIASRLGYVLSEAERRMILENGTQNLVAFLAYADGLVAEDLGDFSRAAAFYQQAVRADPGFQAARQQYRAAASAVVAQQATAGQVTTVAQREPPPAEEGPVESAIASSVGDVAATTSESSAPEPSGLSQPPAANPPATPRIEGTPSTATGTIRVFFRLP